MKKDKWAKRIERLWYWVAEDRKWQKAMNDFCEVIAPQEYAPILSPKYVEAYIEGLARGDKDMKNDLEYVAYDVPMMKGQAMVEKDGRKWNFSKDADVLAYFNEFYP